MITNSRVFCPALMGKGHKAKLFRKSLSNLPRNLYLNWEKFLTNWSLILLLHLGIFAVLCSHDSYSTLQIY